MHHDRRIQTPLRPLSIDFTTNPLSGDTGSGTPQTAIPGGATILMNDSAGTSMALNLDIHPVYGTPLLSGQAITAGGDVLEVHPCSCSDPVASRHNLPMTATPEPFRGGSLFPDRNDPYPSPSSQSRIRQMPGLTRIRTPLVLVQTQLPSSPHATELLQELEIPTATPGPSANLKSPITPTPASVRRTSQTSSTGATYHTTPEYLEESESKSTRTASNSRPLSQRDVPPRLNSIPTVSTFDPDLEMPTISSPSSVTVSLSGISEPSAIGPLPSLPSSSSDSATESTVNRPSSRGAVPQDDRGPSASEVIPLDQPVDVHCASNGTTEKVGVATNRVLNSDSVKPSENKTSSTSTSDLYTDRVAIKIPMPTTRIEPGSNGLQYDLTAEPEPGPNLTEIVRPSSNSELPRKGKIKGTWIANQERDHVALKLDLTLIKLGLQNTSFSSPDSSSRLEAAARPSAQHGPHALEPEASSEIDNCSSQSIVSLGSCPSTAPTLSDLPLTPIPELLRTPTKHSTPFTDAAMLPESRFSHLTAYPSGEKQRHLVSRLPAPLDNGPIIGQLMQGQNDVSIIQATLCDLANEWQNVVMMPDGVALHGIQDGCVALGTTLVNLTPVIMLTWPPGRQPSLGTEGGQPPTHEQQLHLEHMNETEYKWYLKQHDFTTSLQRNLSRLTLLAQRVVEDPDAAYRSNVLERISQFTKKFEDIALRLKLAHHIRVEQKYRARVRHAARRTVASPEQAAALEYHKTRLAEVREDIEAVITVARNALPRRPSNVRTWP